VLASAAVAALVTLAYSGRLISARTGSHKV
jgi:hypothetical protein